MEIYLYILMGVVVILITMAYVFLSLGIAIVSGAPWVPTKRALAKRMFELADIKEGDTVLDLGSGDGSLLFVAVEDFGASIGVGFEINPFLVWYTRFRARRAHIKEKIKVTRGNMYRAPLPDVDIVALYLLPKTMDKLRPRFVQYLNPDAKIVSHAFKFAGVVPEKVIDTPKDSLYLYRVRDLA
ncbi:MAG: 50S ribosomal protein L11 methyltransferase [Candidatus Uhrbacteria bacterium]|nr:50S ribosomal protein L11 methyltransferase [Candidatus Uhrbacteria bacterium]